MSRIEKIKIRLEVLEDSPLYQLSLASRELFHSNFLAWVLQNFGQMAIDAMGKEFKIETGQVNNPREDVHRERHNLDLSVDFADGSLLVIENKVKSIPDKAQLIRYGKKLAYQFPNAHKTFILLHLIEPSFCISEVGKEVENGNIKWVSRSYGDLAVAISRIADTAKKQSPYKIGLLRDYVEFATNLDGLCRQIIEWASEDFLSLLDKEVYKNLRAARIHDLVYKLAFQNLTMKLNEKIEKADLALTGKRWQEAPTGSFWTNTSFTRGQGICDIKYILKEGKNPLVLGIQLQHNNLRLCLESAKPNEGLINPASTLREKNLWFNFAPGADFVAETEYPVETGTKDCKKFNQFGKGFLYRSRHLRCESGLDLVDLLMKFIDHAVTNRKSIVKVVNGS